MTTHKEKFSSLLEKEKFSFDTDPKKLNDDDLMDFIAWLDKNPDKKIMKVSMDQMKKRGFI